MNYSVVICSYNKLESLKLVVSSLIKTAVDCEIILSDDGSTDGTIEWAMESGYFDNIIESTKSDEYCLCTARNVGIKAASHPYIVLLDADCMPDMDFFNGHDDVFTKNPNCLSVGFTRSYDKNGKKILKDDHRLVWSVAAGGGINPVRWMDAYGGNIAFPKSIWSNVGGFDERYNGAWGLEDADFAYMVHKKKIPIMASIRTIVRHLQHPFTGTREMRSGRGPNTKKFKDKHGFFPC